MQRIIVATLMALAFGLFSMPSSQAAPANGAVIGDSSSTISTIAKAQWGWRRRRRRCFHRWRSRMRCW